MRNGVGKTTMVRILATLLRPDAGDGGCRMVRCHSEVRLVRRAISLTGQSVASTSPSTR
jgi:ABC-type Na+ transport system ATPase subunit NatA